MGGNLLGMEIAMVPQFLLLYMLLQAPSECDGYFLHTILANTMSRSLKMSQQGSRSQKPSAGREAGGFLLGAEFATLHQFFVVVHNRGHSQCKGEILQVASKPTW